MLALSALVLIVGATRAEEACAESKASNAAGGLRVFTAEELAKFSGKDGSVPIYISILGHVFDVSTGARHYGPKKGYSHFAGRDATRSFATGDAKEELLTSDLSGMDDDELEAIQGWYEFYDKHETYTRVGRLVGRHFDPLGGAPEPFPFERLAAKKTRAEELKTTFPGCNSKWTQAGGSEVWCTPKSGGISRDWVGVPRRLLNAGDKKERCACVDPSRGAGDEVVEVYEGCDPAAVRCKVVEGSA